MADSTLISALISAEDYSTLAVATADHRIPYGDDPSQFGDLFCRVDPAPTLFCSCYTAAAGAPSMGLGRWANLRVRLRIVALRPGAWSIAV